MYRPLGIVLSLLIVACALLGAPPAAVARPEGTLTIAVATFGNERWLPHLYVGAEDVVLKPMYENLLTRDPKTGELAPMLAERWQVLEGGRTWKFHLRKGIRFHNGAELTAEDVRFTFATLAKEGSANSLAPEFRLIKSMEVEDPYTLTVRFDKPLVVFGNKVNQGLFASVAFIQSKRHVEASGEQSAERSPVATGPWKFVEHVRGDRIVYDAVENHWRVTPQWKRLVFLKVPEPATRMAMLRAGSVDVIEVGGEYVDELKKVGVRTVVMPNVSWVYVILGGQWPTKSTYDPKVPWAQPDAERAKKVRLALNHAVDKQAIMQRVLGGLGTVTNSWLAYPNDPWATDALKKPIAYDPAKARQLLAEAGYPNGFETTMNLTAWPGRGFLPDVGEAVATYWEKVGIRVKRRPVDRAVFSADFRARVLGRGARVRGAAGRARDVGGHVPRGLYEGRAEPLHRASQARRVHRPAVGRGELQGARAHHAGRDGAVAAGVHPRRRDRLRPHDRGRGAEGRRVAAHPRPHGLPQLGVRESGRALGETPRLEGGA